jgi:putative OPT family oligopeptide transporter
MNDPSPPPPKLPATAYHALSPGEQYQPPVSPEAEVPELTMRSLVVGILTAILFGAANAYLGLKVGLTVSASIPAAVIAVAVFQRTRGNSLLESNIVQTIGSAGESLAAGAIFTLPVLYLWGETPGFWPIFPISLLGGLLGVLFMIPLRRLLIVREHGRLSYPEGTACAQVQVAAQGKGKPAQLLFTGTLVGAFYTLLEKFANLWPAQIDLSINRFGFRTSFGADITPELLGVGYIIGPRIAAVVLAGGMVGWLVIIPLIYLFGNAATIPISPELTVPVSQMESFTIWSRYLRYIGAGAVAFGGLFSLLKSSPILWDSLRMARVAFRQRRVRQDVIRTEQDLAFKTVIAGLLIIVLLVAFLPLRTGGALGVPAAIAVIIFSFFFVTVSSRIVGLIGTSSNPVSGMTIATVLICALIFGQLYSPDQAKVAVLTIGSLVCLSAAIAGDTSQDLKTGFLVGATPRLQQIAEIVGVVAAAVVMSAILELFRADIVNGTFKAPQANLIKLVIDGVISGNLPWGLVGVGVALAACVELMGLPTLAFAVGLYLPVHLAVPIMIGGLIQGWVNRRPHADQALETGILYASGLIAGAALMGVFGAGVTFFELPLIFGKVPAASEWLGGMIAFGVLCASVVWVTSRVRENSRT